MLWPRVSQPGGCDPPQEMETPKSPLRGVVTLQGVSAMTLEVPQTPK